MQVVSYLELLVATKLAVKRSRAGVAAVTRHYVYYVHARGEQVGR